LLTRLLADLLRPRRPPAAPPLRTQVEALIQADRCDEARAVAAAALAREPDSYEALLLLGTAHQKLHDPERALEHYARAERLRDGDPELHDLRGATLQELGRLPEALAEYDRAVALHPDFPLARFHRGMARLLLGDFERGWPDYELRLLNDAASPRAPRPSALDATTLRDRVLLLAREQGLGDEIMFASLASEASALAGHCVLECDPRLAALFRRSFPGIEVLPSARGDARPGRPVDFELPIGSLAQFLRRGAADFPRHAGYLQADPQRVAYWRDRLAALGPGMKIGLSWAGGVRKTRGALRTIALERLGPLLRTPGVHFVSLQYTPQATAEIAAIAGEAALAHWPEAIDDYDETAALVCALDLVISVCTSVVHLAGALGRPAWVLAPVGPEWRYGASGESMIWYPSVRVLRQARYKDWDPVVARVAADLARRAG
jgi:hypothetical protein